MVQFNIENDLLNKSTIDANGNEEYYIFDRKIENIKDLKSEGLWITQKLGEAKLQEKKVSLEQVQGCWIAKSWVWEGYPHKIITELPKEAKKEKVCVLNIQYWYIIKFSPENELFVNKNELYIPKHYYSILKMTDLSSKNNIIWKHPDFEKNEKQRQEKFKEFIESIGLKK